MGEIRFDDITPIEESVHIGGADYVLCETSGDAAVRYDNARLACYEYQDGKLTRVHDLANLEPLLVSLCLFQAGVQVPEATVRAWPSRVQRALYDRAREISGMNDPPQALEKQIETLQKQLEEARSREQLPKN